MWGGSSRPASDGLEKLFQHLCGMAEPWMTRNFVDHSYNTAIHPVERMACHLLKNFLVTQCKYRQSFLPQWQWPPQEVNIQQADDTSKLSATSILVTCHTFMFAHLLWYKILSVNSGTSMKSLQKSAHTVDIHQNNR